MTAPTIDIADTKLGKAGLGWVLDTLDEIVRATRLQANVNDVFIYFWVISRAEHRVRIIGRPREGCAAILREVYPEAGKLWDILEVPPTHPDHVTVVVIEGSNIYAQIITLEGLKATGVLN